jgi:SAM-dependent methyltransferase
LLYKSLELICDAAELSCDYRTVYSAGIRIPEIGTSVKVASKGNIDFLKVDSFLKTELAAGALSAAFAMGLIDRLCAGPAHIDTLPPQDIKGKSLLIGMLAANHVVAADPTQITLTDAFQAVLSFRDLLEAKLAFTAIVAEDVRCLLPQLLSDLPTFMAKSKTFELFRYDRCFEDTAENAAHAREWIRFTTALTRYEAQSFLALADLTGVRCMMDLGGNSGEFALRLCRAYPQLTATVFDLPVVCTIGREHIDGGPEAARIKFQPGDMRRDALPRNLDLVTFKSVLHDWPEVDALRLLARARDSVRIGGRLAIFERGRFTLPAEGPVYSMLPNLVFFHFYRSPEFYFRALQNLGFADINIQTVELDMEFHLITGVRRA